MENFEIKTTEQEKNALNRMAKSSDGKVLLAYIKKIIDALGNIKTMKPNETIESRLTAVKFLEENFIDRFKILKGEVSEEDGDIDIL